MDPLRVGRVGVDGGWLQQGHYSTAIGNFQSAPAAKHMVTTTGENLEDKTN